MPYFDIFHADDLFAGQFICRKGSDSVSNNELLKHSAFMQ